MKYIFFLLASTTFLWSSQDCIEIYSAPSTQTYKLFPWENVKLYTLYDNAYRETDNQQRKKLIEGIKQFHRSYTIPYNTPLVTENTQAVLFKVTPLAFALTKDLEFANYLLHEIKVPICSNALHHLAYGVFKHGFSEQYKTMLNYLLHAKADINAEMENKYDFNANGKNTITPLGCYLQHLEGYYDPCFITMLLHAGAKLRKEDDGVKRYNAVSLVLDHRTNERIATRLVLHLLHERLYTVKKEYLNLALVCKWMNKHHKIRVPKVLIEYIGNMIFSKSDARDDIHRALTKQDYVINQPQRSVAGPAHAKIQYAIEKRTWLAFEEDLHTILSLPFWQQSFKNVVIALRKLREKHTW